MTSSTATTCTGIPALRSTEQTMTSKAIGTGMKTPKAAARSSTAPFAAPPSTREMWFSRFHGRTSTSTAPRRPARSIRGSAVTSTRPRLRT